jgi:hypothetical protein
MWGLPRIQAEAVEELRVQGVDLIRDMPEDFPLSERQQRARASVTTGKPWCNPDLGKNLEALKYPICYMDFETVNPAIPRFPGMHPFMCIPFQWSVHRLENATAVPRHFEFLAEDRSDPRLPFLEALLRAVDGAGTIVVYNQTFESGRLAELAEWAPKYRNKIANIQKKVWDLLACVRTNIYHPDFQGSFTLKRVLPALVPDMSYENMEVGNGAEASLAWEKMLGLEAGSEAKRKLRNSLLEYCRQDSLAMLRLVEVLRRFAVEIPG